jgi:hypothetical protein
MTQSSRIARGTGGGRCCDLGPLRVDTSLGLVALTIQVRLSLRALCDTKGIAQWSRGRRVAGGLVGERRQTAT